MHPAETANRQAKEDQDWMLEPFQKGGDVRTFVKHIMKGAEIAVNDPEALLIYSGCVLPRS